jgi:hypothetical protein
MNERDVAGPGKQAPQCDHRRLLERVSDREGNQTEMMKCCECGSVVRRSGQNTLPIK